MQRSSNFKTILFNNSYLLIIAAWLITISFIIDNYWSGNSSLRAVEKNISDYVNTQEKDFANLAKENSFLEKLATQKSDEHFLSEIVSKKYFLFIYKNDTASLQANSNLLFWSTSIIEPPSSLQFSTDKSGFVELSNGYYVWNKVRSATYTAVALIPVKWNYSITNEYLKNKFAIGDNIENEYTLTNHKGIANIASIQGNYLFSIENKNINILHRNNHIAVWLRFIAAFCVLLFIHFLSVYFVQRKFYWGILFLVSMVAALRVLSYFYTIPLNFRQFELFDPSIYGSNIVLKSLGDLLINSVLFLWIALFIRHYIEDRKIVLRSKHLFIKILVSVIGIVALLSVTVLCGYVFRTLVADSQISFDVINFFTLNIYSIVGFIVLGSVAIGYFFLTQIIVYIIFPVFKNNVLLLAFSIAVVGLSFLTMQVNEINVSFELVLVIWLVVYVLLLNNKYLSLRASNLVSSRLVFWAFFFSASISSIIINENRKKEIERRKHYAATLSAKADPSGERVLNTVLTDFRSDALAPIFHLFKSDTTNRLLKDSLLNENFIGYLNRYDTRIYTFDENEQPLFNQDSTSFSTFITILNTQGKPTGIADLYYYDLAYDKFAYLSKKNIYDFSENLLGYVFLVASPKKFKTDALYPELFLKGYNNSIENSPVYSYAVYNKLQMVNSHNNYPFAWTLDVDQIPQDEFVTYWRNGYDELWYKPASDKVVIIAKQDNLLIEIITLFSYLFCSFLFVTGFFWLVNAIIRSKFSLKALKGHWQLSIRNQVHGTIIFISLLSFAVIGVVTILFFISRYHNTNREKLSRTIHVMENELRNSIGELTVYDTAIKLYDADKYKNALEKLVNRVSEIHAADVNLFDLQGNLKMSSLPLPYHKGIISNKMDPMAFFHMNKLKEVQFFKEEKIGELKFISNYVPVIDENGKGFAYLNIPYFTSQTKLRQEISNFLVAIINLNAFIFLIASVVALFITNRITRSFSFISNKMKEVNLGKKNEVIIWKRKDEIGELVNEYNKMVTKLDQSALALAKGEREGAWREMAKQVAHEIKNPLTPMKLSLQYLQKAISSKADNVRELTMSVSNTLVEQIDHLSQIAGQFSQFANIGNPQNEIFDLNQTLQLVIQLHAIEDNLHIKWRPVQQRVLVNADKTHINRLFNNLLQNAIQSVPKFKVANVQVEEEIKGDSILVIIKDNGVGIPEEMRTRIFTPNFTTKSSGTGLGLAMCKSIVEQCKGNMWFETQEGVGTTFFVELPIVPN